MYFRRWMLPLVAIVASAVAVAASSAGCNTTTPDGTCFGHDLKQKMFLLADGFTNLNHGSFGTMPKPVVEAQRQYVLEQEAYPDTWFRVSYYDYVEQARAVLAKLVNAASVDDVVLVENASSAVNSILRSLGLSQGDKVLHLSTAYGMVTETVNWLVETVGVQEVVVQVHFPIPSTGGSEAILSSLEAVLRAHPDVKVCIFSHLSSMPALVEPVAAMTAMTRSLAPSALVLIDGAHAPGQLPVDVSAIAADFYLGNAHKWLYAPKGTAFLWVTPSAQRDTSPEPTVISSSGLRGFVDRYAYTGTRDYTAFATLPTAVVAFRENVLGGEEVIRGYCHSLAMSAGRHLAATWGTSLLVDDEAMLGYMVNVVLPSVDADALVYVQSELDQQYHIYMVYGWVDGEGDMESGRQAQSGVLTAASSTPPTTAVGASSLLYFTRLSAQVYNEMSDFVRLGELVPLLLREYELSKAGRHSGGKV